MRLSVCVRVCVCVCVCVCASQDAARHADLLALQGIDPAQAAEEEESTGPFAAYHSYIEREMGSLINMVKVSEGV